MKVGLCQQQRGELIIPDSRWRVARLQGRTPGCRAEEAGADSGHPGPLPSSRCPSSRSTSGEGESCILIMLVSRQPTAHPRLPREPSLTLGIFTQLGLPDTSQRATPALSNLTTGEEVPKERQSHILQPKVLFSALHKWLSLKQVIFMYRWKLSLLRPQGEILAKERDMVVCTRGCAHKG